MFSIPAEVSARLPADRNQLRLTDVSEDTLNLEKTVAISQALCALYEQGVDCGVESYQGIGVIAWIVDRGNHRIEKSFDVSELSAISDWLMEASREHRRDNNTHSLLDELAQSTRKDPKRVTGRRGEAQHDRIDGTRA